MRTLTNLNTLSTTSLHSSSTLVPCLPTSSLTVSPIGLRGSLLPSGSVSHLRCLRHSGIKIPS